MSGIYRGVGGTGDSNTDATITEVTRQAVIATDAAAEAAADALDTAADAAQTALDRIATAADVVTTSQDALDTADDASQTALDRIATAADVVTTADKLPLAGGTMTGTITNFASLGIDDNATGTKITIADNQITLDGTVEAGSFNLSGDNQALTMGDQGQLEVYFDGTDGRIVGSGGKIRIGTGAGATEITGTTVELKNGVGGTKLATTTTGVDVTGTVTADGLTMTGNLAINNAASGYANIEIGGTDGSYIDLKSPFSDDYDMRFITSGSGGTINANGTLLIQHTGATKLATTTTGINVTGTVTADGLEVDLSTSGDVELTGAANSNAGLVVRDPTATSYGAHFSYDDANTAVSIGGKTNGTKNTAISIGRDNNDVSIPNGNLDVNIDGNTGRFSRSGTQYIEVSAGSGGQSILSTSGTNKALNIGTTDSNQFRLQTNGTNALTIDASQNVGIGNSTPATALDVTGTITADGLNVASSGNGDAYVSRNSGASVHLQAQSAIGKIGTSSNHKLGIMTNGSTRLTVDTNGKVGIGTLTPTYPLHVTGEAGIELYNATGGGDVINLRPSLGDANKFNMSISSYDHSGNGVGPADGISINAYDGVSIATGSGTARQERMRIDATGKVGIGTSSPACHLDVKGSGNGSVSDHLRITSTDTDSKLAFVNTTGNGAIVQSGYDMRFMTNTANTERMRIASSGNVGIGNSAPATALDVTGTVTATAFDLTAIAESKAVTAVDVFVYDTSKDSDGGAWRKRTQGTSWYNEALNTSTRGSRKEFPAVAVIVAESNKVTIYDGDDPAMPMWMVASVSNNMFFEGAITSCVALNGKLAIGCNGYDMAVVNFPSDNSVEYATGRQTVWEPIADRNQNGSVIKNYNISTTGIVNRFVNDVAMTVLPNAPIDSATGLPIPTIAVATDGGVSVIKDDGSVVDITKLYWPTVQFISIKGGLLHYTRRHSSGLEHLYTHSIASLIADQTDETNALKSYNNAVIKMLGSTSSLVAA